MLSQNKVFDEFINDWEKRVNKKEFGSKGFQVTAKKLTPELSKELPPIEEDKQFNNPETNMMWDLKVKKFYFTCLATFEFHLFDFSNYWRIFFFHKLRVEIYEDLFFIYIFS